jgi:hypothetical protein
VGALVGWVGALVGAGVGTLVGSLVGIVVGALVGTLLGALVGTGVGALVGDLVYQGAATHVLSRSFAVVIFMVTGSSLPYPLVFIM